MFHYTWFTVGYQYITWATLSNHIRFLASGWVSWSMVYKYYVVRGETGQPVFPPTEELAMGLSPQAKLRGDRPIASITVTVAPRWQLYKSILDCPFFVIWCKNKNEEDFSPFPAYNIPGTCFQIFHWVPMGPFEYAAKLLFHRSPTRHSDYTVTGQWPSVTLVNCQQHCDYKVDQLCSHPAASSCQQCLHRHCPVTLPSRWLME